jgi:hypothetical protein
MLWTAKGTGGPPLSVLHTFYRQRVLVALQRTHAASISRWAVIAGKGFSRLEALLGLPPWAVIAGKGFSRLEAFLGLPPRAVIAGKGFLRLEAFIRFTSPFFSWYASCDWWKVEFLVVSFPPGGSPLLGLDFGPCPLFLFLFLSWVLSVL